MASELDTDVVMTMVDECQPPSAAPVHDQSSKKHKASASQKESDDQDRAARRAKRAGAAPPCRPERSPQDGGADEERSPVDECVEGDTATQSDEPSGSLRAATKGEGRKLALRERVTERVIVGRDHYLRDCVVRGDIVKIPLRDTRGSTVGYTFVDKADYDAFDLAERPVWRMKAAHSRTYYAHTMWNSMPIALHRVLMAPVPDGASVDHKNGDGYDNRRCNLRHATPQQQGQNRAKKANCSSSYIGVSKCDYTTVSGQTRTAWHVKCQHRSLGSYKTAQEAAKVYDRYVIHRLGIEAMTNNMLTDDEIAQAIKTCPRLTTIRGVKRGGGALPLGVFKCADGSYRVAIKGVHYGQYRSLTVAVSKAKQVRAQLAVDAVARVLAMPITRDDDSVAYIETNKSGRSGIAKSFKIRVDDGDWHAIMQHAWSKSSAAHYASTSGQRLGHQALHQFVWLLHNKQLPQTPLSVHHVNGCIDDARYSNLASVEKSVQAHVTKKRGQAPSSQYYGVSSTLSGTWVASITKHGKKHYLGTFALEIDAAKAYNAKALVLFGKDGHLNQFPEGTDMTITSQRTMHHFGKYRVDIHQCDAKTGKIIRTFPSVRRAGAVVGINPATLRMHIPGVYRGYEWRQASTPPPRPGAKKKRPRQHAVQQCDAKTGDVLATFPSITVAASKVEGVVKRNLMWGLRKKQGLCQHAGFTWRYATGASDGPAPAVIPLARVEQCNMTTGVVIATFSTVRAAATTTGAPYYSLWNTLRGKTASMVYHGFRWRLLLPLSSKTARDPDEADDASDASPSSSSSSSAS
jgi:hypothetical protein